MGVSLSRPLLLRSTGSRRAGSVIVAHGPSCSTACAIFPDQGSNPCPLHWQADSQPLRHQGSPILILKRDLQEHNLHGTWDSLSLPFSDFFFYSWEMNGVNKWRHWLLLLRNSKAYMLLYNCIDREDGMPTYIVVSTTLLRSHVCLIFMKLDRSLTYCISNITLFNFFWETASFSEAAAPSYIPTNRVDEVSNLPMSLSTFVIVFFIIVFLVLVNWYLIVV